ncbi:2'-5' RNA ligase family protein [Solirubrobacter sp. CPCC 204708]|uniref:2'-5' RNA ligase family protein n=1 Tax=Solirubrobacter deserti TaxID=2282478 RepID=A0ABT4RJB6_9ACTN|nr:2'-5' RNA ligase family protein [Solirubrobacter deserti]MBE2317652.1 2'-5' RNA ligase family protein [Solirubrobacter deserti]MDA0138602.1 2'-5' RNA ligase family protein [Solirubrobacter deserti]
MDVRPLVLTATLPAPEQAWLNAWREAYFPPERNHLAAHLTLFHALPGAERAAIEAELEAVAARTPPPAARADRLRFLGAGVAVDIHAPALVTLRAELASAWAGRLTRQDEQPLRPHVTVCNKVTPERARAVERELTARLVPRAFALPGLALFEYAGGPWVPLRAFEFRVRG